MFLNSFWPWLCRTYAFATTQTFVHLTGILYWVQSPSSVWALWIDHPLSQQPHFDLRVWMQQRQGQSLLNVFQTITFWGFNIYYTGRCTSSPRPKEFVHRSPFIVHRVQHFHEQHSNWLFSVAMVSTRGTHSPLYKGLLEHLYLVLTNPEGWKTHWTFEHLSKNFGSLETHLWQLDLNMILRDVIVWRVAPGDGVFAFRSTKGLQ